MSNISTTSLFELIKESELNFIWKWPFIKRYIFVSFRIVLLAFGKTIMKQYFHLLFSLKFIRAFWKVFFFWKSFISTSIRKYCKKNVERLFCKYSLLVSFFKHLPQYLYFRICCKIGVFLQLLIVFSLDF